MHIHSIAIGTKINLVIPVFILDTSIEQRVAAESEIRLLHLAEYTLCHILDMDILDLNAQLVWDFAVNFPWLRYLVQH